MFGIGLKGQSSLLANAIDLWCGENCCQPCEPLIASGEDRNEIRYIVPVWSDEAQNGRR